MTNNHATVRDAERRDSSRLAAVRVATCVIALLGLAACGGGGDGIVEERKQCTVSAVSVQPGTTTISVGDQTTLQAVPTTQNCTTTPSATWSSGSPSVASVNSSSGVVTALTPGTAVITATVGAASGNSVVTVRLPPVASIFVTPPSSLQVGQSLTLSVQPRDERGAALTGRVVTFQTNAANIATVNAAGVVTGVAPGTAIITVSSEGINQPVSITVTARPVVSIDLTVPTTTLTPAQTTQASATPRDATGGALPSEPLVWSSTNTAAVTVSSTGLITAVAPGQAIVRVTSGNFPTVSNQAVITVNVGAPASVSITLVATLGVTQTATATAVVRDAGQNALPSSNVTWSSSNTAVATVVPTTGVVTGVSGGTVNIIATVVGFPAITASKALTVSQPVATVSVAQSNVLLEPGPNAGLTSLQLTVTLRDAAQNVLTGRTITYASSNTAAATVNTTGLVTAVGVGTGTITVSSEGVSTSIPLIVARAFAVIDANQPTNNNSYQPPQINSAGSPITLARTGTGQYRITINGIGLASTTIGRNFTAFVNGANAGINSQLLAPTATCSMSGLDVSGPTIITVLCNDPITLALKDAPFKAVLIGDNSVGGTGTGGAFSLHEPNSGAAYTPRSAFSWNSAGAAMTVTPGFAAPAWNNLQVRHSMGVTFATQFALTGAITATAGEVCEVQAQVPASVSTDIVCFDRAGPINALHTVLKLSSGRPGQNGGLAFIDAVTGDYTNQGFNSGGGSIVSSRSGVGKYRVVFGGMVATGALGVIVSPWGASGWAACSHYVASTNPVSIDVACYNSAGAFTSAMSAFTLLVLQ